MAANLLNSSRKAIGVFGSLNIKLQTVRIKYAGGNLAQQVRNMGGPRTMQKTHTRYEYDQFKDQLHFYLCVHLIPIGLIITYVNMTKGKCVLTEVPEDYEPKYWEYYQHPISKFMKKYFHDSPQAIYERRLHVYHHENEKRKMVGLRRKVEELQAQRQDYMGWYYIPASEKATYKAYEESEWAKNSFNKNFSDQNG